MVIFFPKECPFFFFFSTSLSYPKFLAFSLLFSLGPCPIGLITCSSYSSRNVTRYTRIGVKLQFLHLNLKTTTILCNDWRREKARQCQGSGTEGGSTTTWGARAQPIRGVLQHLTMEGHYLPFVQVLVVHVKCKSYSSPRWSCHWHELKIPISTSIPFPLLTVAPRVRSGSSHASTLTCLGWCNVQSAISVISLRLTYQWVSLIKF